MAWLEIARQVGGDRVTGDTLLRFSDVDRPQTLSVPQNDSESVTALGGEPPVGRETRGYREWSSFPQETSRFFWMLPRDLGLDDE